MSRASSPWRRFPELVGERVIRGIEDLGTGMRFFLEGLLPPFSLDRRQFLRQFAAWGPESLPICLVIASVSAMISAYLISLQVAEYEIGKPLIGGVVASVMVRDLGPVMVALVLAGRVGAATTAEIGSMKLSEQIDALRAFGVDPFQYLVLPRLLAGALMVPMVAGVSIFVAILLGYLPARYAVDLAWSTYTYSIRLFFRYRFLREGLYKTIVFGLLIAIISAYKGFVVREGAQDLGRRVTESVVLAMLVILLADFVLTGLLG